jgi:hypothetical protein
MGSGWFRAGPFCLVARSVPVRTCVFLLLFLSCFAVVSFLPVCCSCDRQPILIQLMEENKTDDAIIVFISILAKIHLLCKLTNTTDSGHNPSHLLLQDLFSSSVFLCCRYPDDVFFFILVVVATTYYSPVVKLSFCSLLLFSEVLVIVLIGQEKEEEEVEEDARRSGKAPSYFLLAESVLRWTKRHSTTLKQK